MKGSRYKASSIILNQKPGKALKKLQKKLHVRNFIELSSPNERLLWKFLRSYAAAHPTPFCFSYFPSKGKNSSTKRMKSSRYQANHSYFSKRVQLFSLHDLVMWSLSVLRLSSTATIHFLRSLPHFTVLDTFISSSMVAGWPESCCCHYFRQLRKPEAFDRNVEK